MLVMSFEESAIVDAVRAGRLDAEDAVERLFEIGHLPADALRLAEFAEGVRVNWAS